MLSQGQHSPLKQLQLSALPCWLCILVFSAFILQGCKSIEGDLQEARKTSLDFQIKRFALPQKSIANYRKHLVGLQNQYGELCENDRQDRLSSLKKLGKATVSGGVQSNREAASRLTALAGSYFRYGQYNETLEILEDAYRGIGSENQNRQGVMEVNIGLMYSEMGLHDRALSSFSNARRHFQVPLVSSALKKRERMINASKAGTARGRDELLVEEYYLRQVINAGYIPSSWWYLDTDHISARLAKNLIHQKRYVEAEVNARLFPIYNTLGLNVLSEAVFAQDRYDDAVFLSKSAISLHYNDCSEPDSVLVVRSWRILFKSFAAQGKWSEILSSVKLLMRDLKTRPGRYEELFGTNIEILLAKIILEKNPVEIEAKISEAYLAAKNEHGEDSIEANELLAIQGILYQDQGKYGAAFSAYKKSINTLQNQTDFTSKQADRFQVYRDKYIEFLATKEGSHAAYQNNVDPIQSSFSFANSFNLGKVNKNLSSAALRTNVADGELAQPLRELRLLEHAAEEKLSAIEFLQTGNLDSIYKTDLPALYEQFHSIEKARVELESNISEKFPAYGELLQPSTPNIEKLQSILSPGELMLVFYVGEKETFVWSLKKWGGLSFHKIELSRDQIARKVSKLRRSLDVEASSIGEIPEFDIEVSNELYEKLLSSVLNYYGHNVTDLVVIPDHDLNILPFGLLAKNNTVGERSKTIPFSHYSEVDWLIDSYSISVVPSATSLVLIRDKKSDPARDTIRFVGFGAPLFQLNQDSLQVSQIQRGPTTLVRRSTISTEGVDSASFSQLPPLPDTEKEINEIASILRANPEEDIFLGGRASEVNAKHPSLQNANVLMFATHGLLPGDLDGLDQPALAFSNPDLIDASSESTQSRFGVDDGFLKMDEIIGMDLNADWVILSACNTGAGEGEGAEAFSGLGQAFFSAGAKSVLLTNWPVETTSARLLTTNIFRIAQQNKKLSRAQALQESMKELRRTNAKGDLYSYAHPVFWAPFTLIGDGG